jgi:hypothetical protein
MVSQARVVISMRVKVNLGVGSVLGVVRAASSVTLLPHSGQVNGAVPGGSVCGLGATPLRS